MIKKDSHKIVVGKFGKIHGVRGRIFIYSFLTKKFDILNYNQFFIEKDIKINIQFTINSEKILGVVNGIKEPEKTKEFVGKKILINKDNLPKLKRNQFYFNDLINLNVYVKKVKIGKVKNVKNHGAGDYLEVKQNKEELLVPFNKEHIELIDLENEIILLNSEYYEI